jgi:hypothetical protein
MTRNVHKGGANHLPQSPVTSSLGKWLSGKINVGSRSLIELDDADFAMVMG